GAVPGGVPRRVRGGVDTRPPAEHDGVEALLLDVFLEEGGPLDGLDIRLDADLLEPLLDDLGDLLALLVALIGPDGEAERLPLLVSENPVPVPIGPPRRGQERPRLGRAE